MPLQSVWSELHPMKEANEETYEDNNELYFAFFREKNQEVCLVAVRKPEVFN